jgi:hypothetical protein
VFAPNLIISEVGSLWDLLHAITLNPIHAELSGTSFMNMHTVDSPSSCSNHAFYCYYLNKSISVTDRGGLQPC